VERRNALSGSDLYEDILAVGNGGIVYLRLKGNDVCRSDIAFGKIAAVSRVLELLSGKLRFDLVDGSAISLSFNAVSAHVIDDFVALVRRLYAAQGKGRIFTAVERGPEPTEEDTLFLNLLHDLRSGQEGLALLAYQAPCVLASRKEGGRRGLAGFAARLLRWRLDSSLLAAGHSELIVLFSGSGAPRIRRSKGYRYEAIYILGAAFLAAAVAPRVLANGAILYVLRVSSTGHDYDLMFERDPSAALSSL
jgi:hypothetical protein